MMNVQPARSILSQRNSAPLRQLVKEHNYPQEYLTTAWFLEKMGRWYDLITSRNKKLALSKKRPEKYQEALDQIDEFCGIVSRLQFCCPHKKDGKITHSLESRKPFKWGTLLATSSIKLLAADLLDQASFEFIQCGKLSTEAIENLFSSVRRKKVAPTPLEFKYILRALLVIKWMKPKKGHNYEEADGDEDGEVRHTWMAELKEIRSIEQNRKDSDLQDLQDYPIVTGDYLVKDFSEENAMSYAIGYMLGKTIAPQGKSSCKTCQQKLLDPERNMPVHQLIKQKDYAPGALTTPTALAHNFYSFCESIWHKNHYAVRNGGRGLDRVMEHLYDVGEERGIPVCHLQLTVQRWHKIRMYFEARQLTNIWKRQQAEEKKECKSKHASASMAAHALKKQ